MVQVISFNVRRSFLIIFLLLLNILIRNLFLVFSADVGTLFFDNFICMKNLKGCVVRALVSKLASRS